MEVPVRVILSEPVSATQAPRSPAKPTRPGSLSRYQGRLMAGTLSYKRSAGPGAQGHRADLASGKRARSTLPTPASGATSERRNG